MNQQQRYQTQQSFPQETQYYIPPQKKNTKLATGLIIIVLIGAVGMYFLMKPRIELALSGNTPQLQSATQINQPKTQTTSQINVFEISTLKLCNKLESNFICEENTARKFSRDNIFYIYAQLKKSNDNNTKDITMFEGMKIVDEKNNVLYDNSNFRKVTLNLENQGLNTLNLNIPMMTYKNDTLGKSTIYITLTDSLTSQKIIKPIDMEII